MPMETGAFKVYATHGLQIAYSHPIRLHFGRWPTYPQGPTNENQLCFDTTCYEVTFLNSTRKTSLLGDAAYPPI